MLAPGRHSSRHVKAAGCKVPLDAAAHNAARLKVHTCSLHGLVQEAEPVMQALLQCMARIVRQVRQTILHVRQPRMMGERLANVADHLYEQRWQKLIEYVPDSDISVANWNQIGENWHSHHPEHGKQKDIIGWT